MTPQNRQQDAFDEDSCIPPELLRALEKRQPGPVSVPAAIDAAILRVAKVQLSQVTPAAPNRQRLRMVQRALWPIAAAACLILAFTLGRHSKPAESFSPAITKSDADAATIILREASALFPNQIRSIVKDASGLHFSLAEKPDVIPGKALVLVVCASGGCQEIITFSGQNIEVAGHRVTVHAKKDGRVILNGERFNWASDNNQAPAPNLSIASRCL